VTKGKYFPVANIKFRPQEDIYMAQLRRLREVACNDKDNFYTWSDKYFSLSIDPFTEKEVQTTQKLEHKSRMLTKTGFHNMISDDNKKLHPKRLHHTKIEELRTDPYYLQQDAKKKQLRDRDKETLPKGKPAFKNFLPKILHGTGDGLVMENMTLSEKIEFERKRKEKDRGDWQKKMVVTDPNFHVNTAGIGIYGLDKYGVPFF
jgi:hypothetical protein